MIETFEAHPGFNGFRVDTGSLRAELIELGGTVTRLEVPDRNGQFGDVLLGCPTIADYVGPHPHFNCLVGRYANRMTNARFTLDGVTHSLDANIPPHHLHGGRDGFGTRRWTGATDGDEIVFRLTSPAGDAGYPGALTAEARYRFAGSRMALEIAATANAPTPVSLTSHHYYNLSAEHGSTIADHEVTINAAAYLPVSDDLTQLGIVQPVFETPFDLRRPVTLGDAMAADDRQIRLAGDGFDHTFVVAGSGLRRAAEVRHAASGRTLVVATDQPGVQFYTGNTLAAQGKHGQSYTVHGGLCLETQQFPDAPNHPNYPSAILRPGARYCARTVFEFAVM
ncbi:MAG: galactose mutarotase [Gammaproteobacteria bacterium]|nr:galactose mutarotase [Gammaproteobacteria bacterium]MYF31417.1 galactose mutarotase [Gammaproteobacteria bacterium]MYK45549.1 galactose mutarotase [Gammaproteobacteria bacterium]